MRRGAQLCAPALVYARAPVSWGGVAGVGALPKTNRRSRAHASHTTSGPTEARQAKEHAPHAHLDASPVPSRLPGAPGPRPVACCYRRRRRRRRRRIASRPPPRVSICSPQTTRTHTHAGINRPHTRTRHHPLPSSPSLRPGERKVSSSSPLRLAPSQTSPAPMDLRLAH
jgi:hypothetical protein